MIYLDSAATTLQKPAAVRTAVVGALSRMASPGRGAYPPAALAEETCFACRSLAAELFDVPEPDRVVFTFSATHGLNIAIKSLVKPGDTVLISGYEHNAVTRPLAAMDGVTVKTASGPLFTPEFFVARMAEEMTPDVRAVVCTHVSNVFGYILPVGEVALLCRQRGVPLVVDASQSAGCLPISLSGWNAAYIAMPGHKGLYGPQGTGLLLCGAENPKPLLEGGTGSISARQTMPDFLPDRLEAGTHNVPGISGLLEGLRYVRRRGPQSVLKREQALMHRTAQGLKSIAGVEVFASRDLSQQVGVLSFRIAGTDCETVGEKLGRQGIAVRSGLHCAPLAHQTAGTFDTGTVRVSFSDFNTAREAEQLIYAVSHLKK